MEISKAELFIALGTLAAVISALWILLHSYIRKDKERLDKYESAHEKSQEQIVQLTGDHRELKGRIDGVEALSTKVLKKINEIKEN